MLDQRSIAHRNANHFVLIRAREDRFRSSRCFAREVVQKNFQAAESASKACGTATRHDDANAASCERLIETMRFSIKEVAMPQSLLAFAKMHRADDANARITRVLSDEYDDG